LLNHFAQANFDYMFVFSTDLPRFPQGLSVGGQLVGSFAYVVESAPAHRRAEAGGASLGSATMVENFTASVVQFCSISNWSNVLHNTGDICWIGCRWNPTLLDARSRAYQLGLADTVPGKCVHWCWQFVSAGKFEGDAIGRLVLRDQWFVLLHWNFVFFALWLGCIGGYSPKHKKVRIFNPTNQALVLRVPSTRFRTLFHTFYAPRNGNIQQTVNFAIFLEFPVSGNNNWIEYSELGLFFYSLSLNRSQVLRNHRADMLLSGGSAMMWPAGFYMWFLWLPTFQVCIFCLIVRLSRID
jgi:hypothetical protein